jgi:hypothetical protein
VQKCQKCHEVQPFTNFCRSSRTVSGFRAYCKRCEKALAKTYLAKPEVKARRCHAERVRIAKLKQIVYRHYCGEKPACVKCGYADERALSIDHVNNDGAYRRKNNAEAGCSVYRVIIRLGFPDTYQILCMNCQFIKQREFAHAKRGGPHKPPLPPNNKHRVLTPEKAAEIRALCGTMSYAAIGRMYGINRSHARGVALGIVWRPE